MFRTEVSRVMATVFYTPGLMELVDSLTRDAHSGARTSGTTPASGPCRCRRI